MTDVPLLIKPGLGFCSFDDCTVVLDVAADRYWRLEVAAGACLEEVERFGATRASSALERLRRLGFIQDVAGNPPPAFLTASGTAAVPLRSSALDAVNPTWSWIDAIAGALLPLLTRVELRLRGLESTLAGRAGRARRRSGEAARLADLAARFDRARRLAPVRPRCLPDCLALLRWARSRGHDPVLVFGVQARPFSAHCWLQDGNQLLTDSLEHVRRFKPILVV